MTSETLEFIGLVLILGSTFWKVFLADTVREIANADHRLRLEQKIDSLFAVVVQHYRDGFPNATKRGSAINLDGIEDSWEVAPVKTYADKQGALFSGIADWVFIIGSIIVLIPKFLILLGAKS